MLIPDHPDAIEELENIAQNKKNPLLKTSTGFFSRPSTAGVPSLKTTIGPHKTKKNFPPPLHTVTNSKLCSHVQSKVSLLTARDSNNKLSKDLYTEKRKSVSEKNPEKEIDNCQEEIEVI